jgi:hypothetical protein
MDGRAKHSSLSKILSSSTFICLYFLFLGHKHFSLSIRIDNETIRAANKIINISRNSCQGSPRQLILSVLTKAYEKQNENSKHFPLNTNKGQEHFQHSKSRTKRSIEDESKIIEDSTKGRMERSMSSRQQKLGPIFYQEPPPTFYFSNDTGKLNRAIIKFPTKRSFTRTILLLVF